MHSDGAVVLVRKGYTWSRIPWRGDVCHEPSWTWGCWLWRLADLMYGYGWVRMPQRYPVRVRMRGPQAYAPAARAT